MTFEEYVAARGQALLRFAFVLTGDSHHAEDVVQIALMQVHRRWRRVASVEHPDAYVRRAVLHAHLDRRRRRSFWESPVLHLLPEQAGSSDLADDIVVRSALWQALATLPAKQRAVLVLRYYEDCDDASIAELLSCAQVTVRSNASRGLVALRAAWAQSCDAQEVADHDR